MSVDKQVAAHYMPGMLEERILGALHGTGKSLDTLSSHEFEALDNFMWEAAKRQNPLRASWEYSRGCTCSTSGVASAGPHATLPSAAARSWESI